MRLIDILVEKTKKGEFEWSEDVTSLCQGHDRQLERLEGDDSFGMNVFIEPLIKEHRKWAFTASECDAEIVTREQYEAALKQSVWDGTGLPPVGVECEYKKYERDGVGTWWCGTVKYVSDCTVVIKTNGCAGETVGHPSNFEFRPIRSERDEAIEEMRKVVTNYNKTGVIHAIEQLYDAGYRKQ